MIYRAKITNIPKLPEILRFYQGNTIVRDAHDVYIEVGTEEEAYYIEEINRLAYKLQ